MPIGVSCDGLTYALCVPYVVRMATMYRTMISLTGPQTEFLKKEAARLGISVSDLLRRIVDAYREPKREGR
jgi:hypothetical protein